MQDVIVVGSGMGSLSAAALLAQKGLKVLILEQNWIPGGCTTSYWRKGHIFEAGATTLVGLDDHMPLKYLLDQTGITLNLRKLELPMQIHLADRRIINKHQSIDQWIKEAEQHFEGDQKGFWKSAYKISEWVWQSSTKYLHFPPTRAIDFVELIKQAHPKDLINARHAFKRTSSVLADNQLSEPNFLRYIDEQLLITAQNYAEDVNYLFGAAALCYTNYNNYYIDGGLINLVNPIISYIEQNGGSIQFREGVQSIQKQGDTYSVTTKQNTYQSKYLISGIPLNNLQGIAGDLIPHTTTKKTLLSEKLYSAFQMGIAFKSDRSFDSIHHQIHLSEPLTQTGSNSIFLSLNHEADTTRSNMPGIRVASVSTHIRNPKSHIIDSKPIEKAVIKTLIERGFISKAEDIEYMHSSGPKSWNKWTGREHGFVGGYPQYFDTKPWQMVASRVDGKGAYLCGDTAYPGQGIPGATLSGIIAAAKLSSDWL